MQKYFVAAALALVVSVAGAATLGTSRSAEPGGEPMAAELAALQRIQAVQAHRIPVVNRSGREVIAIIDGHERYGGLSPEFLAGRTLAPDAVRFIDFSGPDGECLRHLYIMVRGREDELHPLSAGPVDLCSTSGIAIGEIVIPEPLRGPIA